MAMRYLRGLRSRQLGMSCVAAAVWIAASAQQAQAFVADPYAYWQVIAESELANLRGGFFTGSEAFDFAVKYDASLAGFDFRTELSAAEKTFNVTVGDLDGASFVRDADGNLSLVNLPAGKRGSIVDVNPGSGEYKVLIDDIQVADLQDRGPEDLQLNVLAPVPASFKVSADGIVLDIGGDKLRIMSSLSNRRISNNVINSMSTIAKLATTLDIRLGSQLTGLLTTVPPFLQRLTQQSNNLY